MSLLNNKSKSTDAVKNSKYTTEAGKDNKVPATPTVTKTDKDYDVRDCK